MMMLLLAACTSTPGEQDDKDPENQSTDTPNTEVEDTDTDDSDDANDDEALDDEDGTENDDQNEVDGGVAEDDEKDTEDKGNDDSTDQTTGLEQVDSDAQDFKMSISPDYTLTSEEPGRDSLYLTEDGSIFMRIETTPFDQETYDYFKQNTIDLLQATNANQEAPAEIEDPQKLPQDVDNAIGYATETDTGITTGIVFEKDGLLVRLTIFDTADGNHFGQFLMMGETITNK